MNPAPGEIIDGKYRIVRLIGDGGMGSVYEARHELLGVPVALKFLHGELAKRPGLAARFLQEARVSATIRSPHVAHVTDVDTASDGSPYIVMELLSGESLQALLARRGKLGVEEATGFAAQILTGLEAAHSMGVVHRDLKPDNVFVTPGQDGPLLKLIDFGIAKLKESSEYKKEVTRAGVMMGTPEYMAPEQLYAAHEVDHRADLYSLGVILFEMLSGVRPADGDSAEVIITNVLSGRGRRLGALEPGLAPSLVALVERALEPDRDRRFASAQEMHGALLRVSSGAPDIALDATASAGLPATAFGVAEERIPDTVDAPVLGSPAPVPPQLVARVATGTQAAPMPVPLAVPQNRALPRRKRRSSGAKWLVGFGASALVLGAGAVVAWQFMYPARVIPDLPAPDPIPTSSGTAISISPIASAAPDSSPAPETTPNPGTTPAQPRTGTGTSDGTRPSPALPLPFPSFTLPSSLPPLPSTLPPLPSTLPPGFPTALPSALPPFIPQIPGLTLPANPPAGNAPAQAVPQAASSVR